MTTRALTLIVLCGLLLPACGGGPTSPGPAPGPGPAPPPSPTTLTGTVTPYAITSQSYTPTRTGSLLVTLTWTGAADLDLYVTASTCTGYPPDACVLLARSTASSGTREEVSVTATAGTPMLIWIDNFSTTATVSYTVTVTGT